MSLKQFMVNCRRELKHRKSKKEKLQFFMVLGIHVVWVIWKTLWLPVIFLTLFLFLSTVLVSFGYNMARDLYRTVSE